MNTIYEAKKYQDILAWQLNLRVARNERYTQRAFARDLGVRSNRLSEILSGKQGVSHHCAAKMATRLGFNSDEANFFCDLVNSQHARSATVKIESSRRIVQRKHSLKPKPMGEKESILLKTWYHLVILEIVKISGQIFSPSWYARKLEISEIAAKESIRLLCSNSLVTVDPNSGRATTHSYSSNVDMSSFDVKKFHEQALKLAAKSLFEGDVSSREFNSMVIPMQMSRLEEFRLRLRKLLHEFADSTDALPSSDGVFMLSAQLFPIVSLDKECFND